jgi:hypothetical protein
MLESNVWKRFFKLKKTARIPVSRLSFISMFSDETLLAEFKTFSSRDHASNYLVFVESYTRLEQLVSEHSGDTEASQSMARFVSNDDAETSPSAKNRTLPTWLVSQFLIFYATLLCSGCPNAVVIAGEARMSIVSQLETGKLHKLNCNIFDEPADEVFEKLYTIWFPRFIAQRDGQELPPLDVNLIPLPYENMSSGRSSLSSISMDAIARKGALLRKKSMTAFNADSKSSPRPEIVYSKDSFIRILHDQNTKDFEQFIEGEHCRENLLFYESYCKLENTLVENVPLFGVIFLKRSP